MILALFPTHTDFVSKDEMESDNDIQEADKRISSKHRKAKDTKVKLLELILYEKFTVLTCQTVTMTIHFDWIKYGYCSL